MDFQSAMETFAEAWVAANTQTPLTEAAEVQALVMSRASESASTTAAGDGAKAADKEVAESDSEMGRSNIGRLNRGLSIPHDNNSCKSLTRSSGNTAKSIPVHCVVEQMKISRTNDCDGSVEDVSQSSVEMDSYAIVPSQTLFVELVRTALFKLGYASSDVFGAKGALQIRNWKPLSFEAITDDGDATVGEILGELTTVATLRIRLFSRPKVSTANDVKEKLLQLLLTQSHSLLVEAGCPIDENLLTLISKGGNLCEIPEETRLRFDKWYVQQVLQHRRLSPSGRQTPGESSSSLINVVNASSSVNHHHHHHLHNVSGNNDHTLANQLSNCASISQRTRMRTSFDPELELPKLHRWFSESQHPTRLQIQQYVRELNGLESRKGRKPLDVNNVVYWFKNARAAYKRAEQRHLNGSHSPSHDSTSNDNPGREPSPEEIDTDSIRCRKMMSEQQQSQTTVEARQSSSTPATSASGKQFGGNSGNGNGNGNSTEEDGVNGNHEAMDLSTTHREVEQSGGTWKSSTSAASGSLKEDLNEDNDNEDDAVNTDHVTSVKHEPVDGSSNSVADTDEEEDEDGDDDDEDEMEDEVDFVESSAVLSQSSLHGHQSDDGNNEMNDVGHVVGRKVMSAFHYMNSSHSGQQALHLQTSSSSSSVSPLSPHPLRNSAVHQPHYHHHHSPTPSMLYMAGFIPSAMAAALDERRKRNRTFIDPVTEVPRLEQWFTFNTHPPHSLILKYTDELNQMPYRQKFPKLEPKNVQFWFKNRRAKCKRLRLSVNLVTSPTSTTAAAASW
ncbi:hypothetical protein CHUAL_002598 [Chamberlinius hualienensis]